ncbi:hypothetical protein GCM10027589_41190 [Actinocorallia lasiicapitis]
MIATPVSDYAAAVRAALADVPATDRAELLEDLEDHLAEIAADSDTPLETRLGPPESYAAELRAAYTDSPPKHSPRVVRLFDRFENRLADLVEHRMFQSPAIATVLRDARPMWWVARGYLVGYLAWEAADRGQVLRPHDVVQLFLLVAAVAASVWFGARARSATPRRPSLTIATVLLTVGALWAAMILAPRLDNGDTFSPMTPREILGPNWRLGELDNLYPYTKDGQPLDDVLIYDQYGKPVKIVTNWPLRLAPGSGPANSYPHNLCQLADAAEPRPKLIPECPLKSGSSFPAVAPPSPPTTLSPTPPKPTSSPKSP